MGKTAPFQHKEGQRKVPFKYSFSSPSISCKFRQEENHTYTHFLTSTKLISMYAHGYTEEIPMPSPCGPTARNKSIKHRSLEQDPAPTDAQSTIIAAVVWSTTPRQDSPLELNWQCKGDFTQFCKNKVSVVSGGGKGSQWHKAGEFTQPDHLPFESLPGCCSLAKQIIFKFFFCILGTVVLMQFFSCLPSAKLPHFSAPLTPHTNPGAFGLPGAVPLCWERAQCWNHSQLLLHLPLFLSGVYFSHKNHLEADTATSAHSLNSSSFWVFLNAYF